MGHLELRGIRKSFGALTVLDDVSLSVKAGEALGIIGPNGAGKSTLFHTISGVLSTDAGSIVLDGADVTRDQAFTRCRKGIGRAYQVPKPFAGMSVFENLLVAATYGASLAPVDAYDNCDEILTRTGLKKLANKPAGSLRLLDRKRLELAKALATDPKLLLLDEIAGGLTEDECDELFELIKICQKQGMTIVWIEHVVRTLMQFASRLVVLDFGRVLADGDPEEVWNLDTVQMRYVGIGS